MNVHDLLTPADCVPPVLCPPVSPAEGVYAWIGINFVLGRFDHADEGEREVFRSLSSPSPAKLILWKSVSLQTPLTKASFYL